MPLAQLAEPWPKMELVQLEAEVRGSSPGPRPQTGFPLIGGGGAPSPGFSGGGLVIKLEPWKTSAALHLRLGLIGSGWFWLALIGSDWV